VTDRLPLPRVVPGDAEVLERRARALAAGEAGEDSGAGLLRLVAFRLGGRPCAVDSAVVARAVVLASPMAIPVADGSERPVAFVEERPLPVADLAGAAAGGTRAAAALSGAPALVLETADGMVAVAVEGPLELAEDRLAAAAAPGATGEVPRVAGRLAGGAALVDAPWLSAWAAKAVRP
jgi:chemotaxis signal transduction protein